MELGVSEAFWAPQGGLGRSPRNQPIQSYLKPKTSLKWQCQRQLATARFAYLIFMIIVHLKVH